MTATSHHRTAPAIRPPAKECDHPPLPKYTFDSLCSSLGTNRIESASLNKVKVVTTNSQSSNLSWCQATIWGP
jgi:hypothetical protein